MGFATAAAIAGIAASGYQVLKGAQAESAANKAAKDAANTASRIAENDKFLALNVPTLGIENAQQNMQAWQQQQIQGLKDIGAAGVLGGVTASGQQARAQNRELSADAQQMQYQRDMAQAQNAQQIEQGRMQREFGMNQAQLAGAQQAAAEARQAQAVGIQGGLNSLSSAATLQAYRDVNAPKTPPANLNQNTTGNAPLAYNAPTAANAFAAQISSMRPQNTQINNPSLNQLNQNVNQANYMAGLRGAQGQYEAMQLAGLRAGQGQFNNQYQWNPVNNEWIQNAPY